MWISALGTKEVLSSFTWSSKLQVVDRRYFDPNNHTLNGLKKQNKTKKLVLIFISASLVAQTVKCLCAMQETWVQFLGEKDSLEKEMAAHSSILAWKIPWTMEPGRLPSMRSQRVRHDWATSLSLSYILLFFWQILTLK